MGCGVEVRSGVSVRLSRRCNLGWRRWEVEKRLKFRGTFGSSLTSGFESAAKVDSHLNGGSCCVSACACT